MNSASQIVALLRARGQSVSCAESCTGGLIGAALTEIPGSSAVFPGGVISYSCGVKHRLLGVDDALLAREGAVCPQVAVQMAEGVRRLLDTDYALSVTGLAGPDGDGSGKPVGLVYCALASAEHTAVRELHLSGNRRDIRAAAASETLQFLLDVLTAR